MNEEEGKSRMQNKKLEKLPFSLFICPKPNSDEIEDYKQVLTDIISDRIKTHIGRVKPCKSQMQKKEL